MVEVIQHERNGLLVNEMTASTLAQAIDDLVNGPADRFDRAEIADRALTLFDPKRQAAGYIRLFKSLLKK